MIYCNAVHADVFRRWGFRESFTHTCRGEANIRFETLPPAPSAGGQEQLKEIP